MGQKATYIAFDESIQIKTHNSQQAQAAIELSRYGARRRILTGKPITQGPHDLWGQMRAIGQLDGRNFYSFRAMFCRMGGFKNKQVLGTQNEDILAGMIEPHVFRATKEDWLPDNPRRDYTVREYKMTSEQREQYKSMEHEFILWLNESDAVTIDAAITKYMKLAQIQCGFIIDTDNESKVHVICEPDRNPRIQLLDDILRDELTGKAIVVFVHRYSFEILKEYFKEYNPAFITGGLTPEELNAQKLKFNADSSCRIILVQERAGKFGHTLLGDAHNRCATTIFFENSYSLDDRSQVEDRNHRRGQTAPSVLYIDLCGTSMDRNVIRALQRKEAIFQAVFKHIKKAVPA
jgi:SNF2 family DNA or RNA helicase